MVGVCVPLFEELEAVESVNAHRAAFFAASAGSFFRRSGSAADIFAGAVAVTCVIFVKYSQHDCGGWSGEKGRRLASESLERASRYPAP